MAKKIKLLNNGEFVRKDSMPRYEWTEVECPLRGSNGEDYLSVVKSIPSYEVSKIIASLLNEYAELGFEYTKTGSHRWLKDTNTGAWISESTSFTKKEKCYLIRFNFLNCFNLTDEAKELARSCGRVNFLFTNYIKHLYEEREAIKNQQEMERLVREYRKENA